jgi:hypothetical protein
MIATKIEQYKRLEHSHHRHTKEKEKEPILTNKDICL